MPKPWMNMEGEEAGSERRDAGLEDGQHLNQDLNDAPRPGQLRLSPASVLSSAEPSPSPAGEGRYFMSLPWEVVAHIASHIPAQFVLTVCPQVCHAFAKMAKDITAWQLRLHRLTAPASFPLVPSEDFNLPAACVEMEQMITCWAGNEEWAAREAEREREKEREYHEQGEGGAGEPGAGGEDEGRAQAEEGGEAPAQEVGIGPEEMMEMALNDEVREMQLEGGGLPLGAREGEGREEMPRWRERRMIAGVLEDMEVEERVGVAERDGHEEPAVDPRLEGGAGNGERAPARSPSPPPALERLSLPTTHIGGVLSVLMVGGDGEVCAAGSQDGNVTLWDLRDGSKLMRSLRGWYYDDRSHMGWVRCLATNGAMLASGSSDCTVRLWDLATAGIEMTDSIRATASILCVAYQAEMLLVGTYDRKVNIYDPRVHEHLVKSLSLHSSTVDCLTADDNYIVSASRDYTMAIYDCRAGKPLQHLELGSFLCSMQYCDSELWVGDNLGMLHIYSLSGGYFRPVSQFDVGHTSQITGIHKSTGTLYTCSTDRTIKMHLPCGPPRTICTLRHQAGVNGLSVKAGVLAIASGMGCVEMWRVPK